jgi:hypothetical protein
MAADPWSGLRSEEAPMKLDRFPNTALVALLVAALSAVIGCDKKDAEADDSDTDTTNTPVSGGGGGGSSDKMSYRGDVTALATVRSGMLPGSLDDQDAAGLALLAEGPCAATDGFFDCQPVLLKIYLGMARQSVGVVQGMLAGVTDHVAALGVGEGSIEPEDGKFSKISYKIASEDTYELLFETSAGPFLHFSAAAGHYELTGDMARDPEGEGAGKIHVAVDYEDDDTFSTEVRLIDLPCKTADIRAPQNIAIKVDRDGSVWKGKAHMYLPRWLVEDDAPCDLVPTESTKMFIATDFVGSEAEATVALYMADTTAETAETLTTEFPASEFCANFPAACHDGYAFGDPNPISTYTNNFCVEVDAETAWGGNCDSEVADVASGAFGPGADWILPDEMDELTAEVPNAL